MAWRKDSWGREGRGAVHFRNDVHHPWKRPFSGLDVMGESTVGRDRLERVSWKKMWEVSIL